VKGTLGQWGPEQCFGSGYLDQGIAVFSLVAESANWVELIRVFFENGGEIGDYLRVDRLKL
jgi:hypothetical protein